MTFPYVSWVRADNFKSIESAFRCRMSLLATLCLGFTVVGCGGDFELEENHFYSSSSPILNGSVAEAEDYPAVGAILVSASLQNGDREAISSGSLCTGTLIEPDVVLTAAHCLDPGLFSTIMQHEFGDDTIVSELKFYFSFAPDVTDFRGFGLAPELPPMTYRAAHLIAHEDFSLANFSLSALGLGENHDIGLIYLDRVVAEVEPSILMRPQDADQIVSEAEVSIAGYGQSNLQSGQSLGIKYYADTVISEVGEAEMQVGREAPFPQKCRGDSGGPTMMNFDDGLYPAYRVVGVTSHAYSREDCTVGGVDTRVDIHWNWLDATMVEGCSRGLRAGCPKGGNLSTPAREPTDRLDGYSQDDLRGVDVGERGSAEESAAVWMPVGCSAQVPALLPWVLLLGLLPRRRRF